MHKIQIDDIVIKSNGGNKMRVMSITDSVITCGWVCDKYFEDNFEINELVLFSDYIRVYNREKTIHDILDMDRF